MTAIVSSLIPAALGLDYQEGSNHPFRPWPMAPASVARRGQSVHAPGLSLPGSGAAVGLENLPNAQVCSLRNLRSPSPSGWPSRIQNPSAIIVKIAKTLVYLRGFPFLAVSACQERPRLRLGSLEGRSSDSWLDMATPWPRQSSGLCAACAGSVSARGRGSVESTPFGGVESSFRSPRPSRIPSTAPSSTG